MTLPEEITRNRIEYLERALRALQAELREILEGNREGTKPVDLDEPIGRISRIDALQQQQMARASRTMQQRRLLQIEHALQAIEDGEYGYCRECGDELSWKRLRARPEAPFCIACQEQRE